MPVVFEEIESTVVPDASRGQSTPSPSRGATQNEMTLEQIAMNLRRLARAQMRLAAD